MPGFNHNVKIGAKIYHIQTEQIEKNNSFLAESHIFLDGKILTSKKNEYNKNIDGELIEFLKKNHSFTLKYLRNAFEQKKALDIYKIKSIIDLLIEYSDNSILSAAIIYPNKGELVRKENNGESIDYFYNYYLNVLNSNPSNKILKSLEKFYLYLGRSRTYVIVGKIPKTELIYIIHALEDAEDFLNDILIPQFVKLISDLSENNIFFGQHIPYSFHV